MIDFARRRARRRERPSPPATCRRMLGARPRMALRMSAQRASITATLAGRLRSNPAKHLQALVGRRCMAMPRDSICSPRPASAAMPALAHGPQLIDSGRQPLAGGDSGPGHRGRRCRRRSWPGRASPARRPRTRRARRSPAAVARVAQCRFHAPSTFGAIARSNWSRSI